MHRSGDKFEVLVGLFIQLWAITPFEQLGVTGDSAQGFLQVVRGYVGKLLQLRIGTRQLLRVFQNVAFGALAFGNVVHGNHRP